MRQGTLMTMSRCQTIETSENGVSPIKEKMSSKIRDINRASLSNAYLKYTCPLLAQSGERHPQTCRTFHTYTSAETL